jgi:NADH dehydrogenase [ubiquinone] 1 alpha subcomplex assembly factor 1
MGAKTAVRLMLVVVGLWSSGAGLGAASALNTGGTPEMIIVFQPGTEPWRNIDDVVMGGLSSSEMVIEDGVAVFRGDVSLDNYGGFASVRSEPADHDLSAFDGLVLRVRGDGKRYKVRLRTTGAFDGPSYQATIEPAPGEWQEIMIPFREFEPVFRGRRLPDHPPLDPGEVKTIGLLIADKQAGAFRLELEWIAGYREQP